MIQVSGLGLDREEITAVAESVADVGATGWAELAVTTEDCLPPGFAPR